MSDSTSEYDLHNAQGVRGILFAIRLRA